jgi:hypothetical protein
MTARRAMPDAHEFGWSDESAIVLNRQPRTAVYLNPRGQLVIRQEADFDETEDPYLYFSQENVIALCYGLFDAIGAPYSIIADVHGGCVDIPRPGQPGIDLDATNAASDGFEAKGKDPTAAERQRRRRERKRHDDVRPVERDAGVTVTARERDHDGLFPDAAE